MSDRKSNADEITATDLANLDFFSHLQRAFPGDEVLPDDQVFDLSDAVTTDVRAREQHRRAKARKLVRLFRECTAA